MTRPDSILLGSSAGFQSNLAHKKCPGNFLLADKAGKHCRIESGFLWSYHARVTYGQGYKVLTNGGLKGEGTLLEENYADNTTASDATFKAVYQIPTPEDDTLGCASTAAGKQDDGCVLNRYRYGNGSFRQC